MRTRVADVLSGGLVVLCIACGGSQSVTLLPQDLAGSYRWQIPGTATTGSLTIHADPLQNIPDSLWVRDDAVFECEFTSSCPLACGPICVRARNGQLLGTLTQCAEQLVPVSRTIRDPRTGEVRREKDLVRRNDCREVPVVLEPSAEPDSG